MGCSATLDFSASQPTPFAYYKLEQADGNAVDSISAYNFVNTGDPAQLVSGKIDEAYDLTDHGSGGVSAKTPSTIAVDFADIDFTIRFWVKQNGLFFSTFLGDSNFNWAMQNGLDGAIHCQSSWMSTLPFEIVTSNINDGNFHRIIYMQREADKKIFLKLDNNSTQTYAFATANPGTAGASRFTLDGFSGLILDEISIWKSVLTESEMLFDWNGGAGITWPW